MSSFRFWVLTIIFCVPTSVGFGLLVFDYTSNILIVLGFTSMFSFVYSVMFSYILTGLMDKEMSFEQDRD